MTKVSIKTVEFVKKIVERHVPDIDHKLLHVNTRQQMEKLIIQMIEKKKITPTLLTISALATSWNDILYMRSNTHN